MEGKSSGFFVLIGIVAFLSLALVLLAGYVFFVRGSDGDKAAEPEKKITVPKDDELSLHQMFDKNIAFNLKSSEKDTSIHIILVNLQVQYYTKLDGIESTTVKIESNKSKLSEMVGTYFQGLTIDDVKKTDAKEKARADLKKMMNDYLLQNETINGELVYSIIFEYWFYQ
ncbi:flagellar basal body-associated FliL family protein [Acetivibrio cellulolyticus]|uniref:flagellar basal body-associated FliL family protein n=1 Tax=Acetivibrio cellulolyticus TaxID=35830 RepID=UPI0001E2C244|nr:flagellar basal body-associated FliL family protein [Acetivibrio cellulolyticus]